MANQAGVDGEGAGMTKSRTFLGAALLSLAALSACGAPQGGKSAAVDDKRLVAADADVDNWLSYGRTYEEQRFSPLTDINATNVSQLSLEWFSDLDTARGQEATPIVVDGVMYVSTAWSMVKAYDAATGKKLWEFDPKVPREKLVDVCCDAVNRGVAVYKGRVYVATLAGDLIALNADTGAVLWKKDVTENKHMAITGAPRIVKGNVLIGNAGAEYIVRGYIGAYNAETGKEVWKFYTVPGDPSKPFEGKHLEAASKTWPEGAWKLGGGGTVWDSITYDPVSDLVYFGTANAEPWNPAARGSTGGDSLYTASIVAVKPDTGEYVWHFQETPEDRWDYDSNQQITVANVKIGGEDRRVVMHAPKNGFFYTLDAKTGKFISGKPFAKVNWASGLDPVTGRPNINPEARYELTGKPFIGLPGAIGAHSWTPMSYSPKTGLVYIPANEVAQAYMAAGKDWKPSEVGFQLGLDNGPVSMPADPAVRKMAMETTSGSLVAWDPIAGKARWTVQYPGPTNGGTLATAGNLVFQGTAGGEFRAYTADTGKQLWSFKTQTGVIAPPITYRVKGVQYVALQVGWGGVMDVAAPGFLTRKSGSVRNISRMLVFKIGGKATLPAVGPEAMAVLDPPPFTGKPTQLVEATSHYANSCGVCHGDSAIAGGLNPDLRHSASLSNPKLWQKIVHDGMLKDNGMVGWSKNFSPAQIENIRQYVIMRANQDKALEQKKVASR
jgi:quinohemoprotein ethanol dehydrogenase